MGERCDSCGHWHIGDIGPCGQVRSLGRDRMGADDVMCGCCYDPELEKKLKQARRKKK